jgi:predicted component of type VI protein secretion system
MAYLIFADRKGELARHALDGAVTIGRSPECTLVIRDVLLSRRHCQVEPMLDRWVISDLGSKNGTFVDEKRIDRHTLDDGDVVRIGKTSVCFRAGEFVPAPAGNRPPDIRPVDPIEALAGTVAGFRVEPDSKVDTSHFPRPQPKPAESKSMTAAEANDLVTGLSSSQWDDLVARGGRTGKRKLPKVSVNEHRNGVRRPRMTRRNAIITASAAVATVLLIVVIFLLMR